jgi:hypothetical protein
MKRSNLVHPALVVLIAASFFIAARLTASACPFCNAETRTLSEEIQTADAAVLAKLAGPNAADLDTGNAKFKIVKVLSGYDVLGDKKEIETVFFGAPDTDQVFLVSGIGTDYTEWATPLPLSAAAMEYLGKLSDVPESGGDRLAFFQEYLENSDPLLAQDAYEEFARAAYADLHELKNRIHHDRLIKWIKDPEVSPTRRRLYLTMLGVGGSAADLPMLEEMIISGYEDKRQLIEPAVAGGLAMGGPLDLPTWTEFVKLEERRKKLGLDALIACYMVLRGPDGLNLIDERLLKAKNVDYSQVYLTIMALRFLGEETKVVPRERLLASVRLLLDNPEFADQVIPDLARWEDWSVLDRLVTMFKTSDANGYIRPPVVVYLLAAMEQPNEVGPRATAAMAELEKIDPEVVKRAKATMAFGFLQRARTVAPAEGATRPAGAAPATNKPVTAKEAAKDDGKETKASPPVKAAPDVSRSAAIPPVPASFGRAVEVAAKSSAVAALVAPPAEAGSPSFEVASPVGTVALPPLDADPTSVDHTLLVVGVPVGATALLAGLYWTILRGAA